MAKRWPANRKPTITASDDPDRRAYDDACQLALGCRPSPESLRRSPRAPYNPLLYDLPPRTWLPKLEQLLRRIQAQEVHPATDPYECVVGDDDTLRLAVHDPEWTPAPDSAEFLDACRRVGLPDPGSEFLDRKTEPVRAANRIAGREGFIGLLRLPRVRARGLTRLDLEVEVRAAARNFDEAERIRLDRRNVKHPDNGLHVAVRFLDLDRDDRDARLLQLVRRSLEDRDERHIAAGVPIHIEQRLHSPLAVASTGFSPMVVKQLLSDPVFNLEPREFDVQFWCLVAPELRAAEIAMLIGAPSTNAVYKAKSEATRKLRAHPDSAEKVREAFRTP